MQGKAMWDEAALLLILLRKAWSCMIETLTPLVTISDLH